MILLIIVMSAVCGLAGSIATGQPAVLSRATGLRSPADSGSALPFLATAPDGRIFISWVEPAAGKGHELKFSVLGETSWSAPRTIASGTNWFVNWADFPSMVVLPDGAMAAHWLARSGPDPYAYDIQISRSFDGGVTWTEPLTPHRDSTETEHGFVSLFPAPDGALGAVWLDGREMAGEGGEAAGHDGGDHSNANMTLRYATIVRPGWQPGKPSGADTGGRSADGATDGTGIVSQESVLDARVCECCQTSAAMTTDGPIVVYRDRLEGEIRDISVVRRIGGSWSAPSRLSIDGWKIDGCPVNGPAIDASGRSVAVAWFTAAGDTPKVKLAFSGDAGGSFGAPIIVDDGSPSGRVDVVLLDDGSAVVSWLERAGGAGEVRARRVHPDGTRDYSITVAPSGTARSNGFPRLARSGNRLVFAWTSDGVHTAVLTLP